MAAVSESRFRVRYAESDQMGYAHHSAFVVWVEQGRVDWLREQGLSYRELEQSGVLLPVTRAEIRYKSPGRFDDDIVVRTWLRDAGVCRVRFLSEVLRVEASKRILLAEAEIDLATVSTDGRVRKLPDTVREALAKRIEQPQAAKEPKS